MPRFFSKKRVESRGNASGRAPLKRGTPLCLLKRRRGSKGEPSPGVPPFIFFALYVCAVSLGGSRYLALPFDPISLVLAQRNGVEPPKKSAFLPRCLHHPRERYKSVDYSFLARLGEGVGGLPGAQVSLTQSAVMLGLRVRGRGGWAHQGVVEASKRFSLAARHRFFGQAPKKWGRKAGQGNDHLPTYRRTRTKRKEKGETP